MEVTFLSRKLSKQAKRVIFFRILGYNLISGILVFIGFASLAVLALILYIRMGPREQYYFPVVISALIAASAISKTLALRITKAQKVTESSMLLWYNEVALNTKIFGVFPMVGILKPTLYHAKMDCPNAFACGFNLFWLAKLPVFGSAIVLSDELIELFKYDRKQMQAILAHELGHIVSLDVAIASALALASSIFGIYLRVGTIWRIILGFEFLLLLPIILVWKLLNALLSQVRELVADLNSVKALNSVTDLCNALSRIAEFGNFPDKSSPFSDLFLSHPRVLTRIKRLQEIEEVSKND